MVIHLLGEEVLLELNPIAAKDLLERIVIIVEESGLVFSHLKIDGIEIHNDFLEYLESHLERIERIEIFVKNYEGILVDMLGSVSEYLERAVPEIAELSKEYYQGPSDNTWQRFDQFVEGQQWLVELVESVKNKTNIPNYQDYRKLALEMQDKIRELSAALSDSDYTLTADILNFEVIPLMRKLNEKVKSTIKGVGIRDDSK